MKRYKSSLMLLSLLVLTSLLGFFSMNGFAQSTDLNYTFENDILYDSGKPLINKTFNVRNASEYTGHYPATYSFENQEVGDENNDIDFLNGSVVGLFAINESINGHDKVMYIHNNGLNPAAFSNSFNPQISGTLEFWWNVLDATGATHFYLYTENNERGVQILVQNDALHYRNATHTATTGYTILDNTWFHIRIEFDCTTDTYDLYANNEKVGDDLHFRINGNGIIKLRFLCNDDIDQWVDAFGYSWDNGYTENNFNTITNPYDLIFDGTSFWILDFDTATVYEYNSNGILTGDSFDVSNEITFPKGLSYNGTSFFVVDDIGGDEVYEYNLNGDYTGFHFDTSGESNEPFGITFDGNSFWIVDTTDNEVYNYNSNGDYTSMHFDTSGETSAPTGITFDGNSFWIVDDPNIYEYNSNGVYTGNFFDVSSETTTPTGITFNGNSFWVSDIITDKIYEYLNPYFSNNNLIPTLNISQTIQRVDKYEFALSDIDTWYDILDEDPSGFNTYVVGTGDSYIVKIVSEDRRVLSQCYGQSSQAGIKKEDFDLHGEFVNITVGIRYTDRLDILGFGLIRIYSNDNTEVLQLRLDDNDNLEYYNGSDYILLYANEVDAYKDHEFYAFINYEIDIVFLTHIIDGEFFRLSVFPLIATGKEGLKAVDVGLYTITDDTDIFIQFVEYIGVYVNGTSQADEFGYIAFDLETLPGFDGDWLFIRNNLFSITAKGVFTIGVSAGKGYFEDYFYSTLIGETQYNNIETLYNLYFVEQETSYPQPFIIIYLEQDNSFENLTLLHIEGVILTEESNEYLIDFTHGNVDINESYFYVSNNKLRGICRYDDSDLEYIQANFDIDNVLNENRSIRLRSIFSGQYGFFSLSYIDSTSSIISLPIRSTSHNIHLPQAKTVDEFVFLITDDDDLEAGYGSGYITDVELSWNPSISISILTISLIMIIIPIIIIIVPTLTLYSRFGKSVIMPVFIFMCVICFAGGLIPAWLFFILMIGSGGFLVLRKGDDG